MFMNIKFLLLLAIVTLSFFSGCEQTNPKNNQNETEISADVFKEDPVQSYPVPNFKAISTPVLTPDPLLGIVNGRILHKGDPVVGYSIYLADLLANDKGEERIASLKISSSPQAVLDSEGYFVFNNVKPDRYALMFSDGISSYLLLEPELNIKKAIIIEVIPGNIIDLGELNYVDFPID